MKILLFHPFGSELSNDWNHRLKRQIELMSQRCDLRVLGLKYSDNDWLGRIKNAIKEFNPDVVYVNGYMVAYEVLKVFDKVVYDMGSWKSRNILIDEGRITYKEMRKMNIGELRKEINRWGPDEFQREDYVLKKAKAIIIWESEEAEFVEKIHEVKVNQISMMFYDLPEPIRWEDKEKRIIAISAKWRDRQKNHRLITHLNGSDTLKGYSIYSVGRSDNSDCFVEHSKLMDRVNKLRVVFCPYFCGGIGVINEGLKLGCNVIVGDWHPYLTYINDSMIISSRGNVKENAKECIMRALESYYPPKKELPSEEEQLNKIIKTCEQVVSR